MSRSFFSFFCRGVGCSYKNSDMAIRIRRIRGLCDETQKQFSERLEVGLSTINNWEQRRSAPNIWAVRELERVEKAAAKRRIEKIEEWVSVLRQEQDALGRGEIPDVLWNLRPLAIKLGVRSTSKKD